MSKLDMNKLMQQAQQMQAQMQQAQEEAANEIVEASAGGGMVTVKATGGGEIVGITIDPKAIDPDDPEMLADLVLAAVNEALRSASALMESKMQGMIPAGSAGWACRGSRRALVDIEDPRLGRRVQPAPRGEVEVQIAPHDLRVGDARHDHVEHRTVDSRRLAARPAEELDEVLDERRIADPDFHGDTPLPERSPFVWTHIGSAQAPA